METTESVSPLISGVSGYSFETGGYNCDVAGDSWCLSDKVTESAQLINIVFISGFLSLVGIVTNVIHLIIFICLGFRDKINISLFALSISDLGASIMLVWVTICFNPLLIQYNVPIDSLDIYYYTGAFPRDMCMMISAFLTTFISVERCLCIFFPLKVKSIMTTKVVTSIIIAIYVMTMASLLHAYSIFHLGTWWNPLKNISSLTIYYHDNHLIVETAIRNIYAVYTVSCYLIVSACTLMFAWKLKQRSIWRQTVSRQKDMTSSSVRDQQIVKTVTLVAAIFILCYFPGMFIMFLMLFSPEIDLGMRYHNLYVFVDSFCISIGAINSSVNIFVYYNMMSKYKAVFKSLFTKKGRES